MSGVTKLDRTRNEIIGGIATVGELSKKRAGKEFEVVWACIEMRRIIYGQESDGDRGKRCRGKEGEEVRRASGWITSRTTCRIYIENCQGMKHNAVLTSSSSSSPRYSVIYIPPSVWHS